MQPHRQHFRSDCAVGEGRGVQHVTVCLQQVHLKHVGAVSVRLGARKERKKKKTNGKLKTETNIEPCFADCLANRKRGKLE